MHEPPGSDHRALLTRLHLPGWVQSNVPGSTATAHPPPCAPAIAYRPPCAPASAHTGHRERWPPRTPATAHLRPRTRCRHPHRAYVPPSRRGLAHTFWCWNRRYKGCAVKRRCARAPSRCAERTLRRPPAAPSACSAPPVHEACAPPPPAARSSCSGAPGARAHAPPPPAAPSACSARPVPKARAPPPPAAPSAYSAPPVRERMLRRPQLHQARTQRPRCPKHVHRRPQLHRAHAPPPPLHEARARGPLLGGCRASARAPPCAERVLGRRRSPRTGAGQRVAATVSAIS